MSPLRMSTDSNKFKHPLNYNYKVEIPKVYNNNVLQCIRDVMGCVTCNITTTTSQL